VTIVATHAWPNSSVARRGTYALFTGRNCVQFLQVKPRDCDDTPPARKIFRANRNNRTAKTVGYEGGIRRSREHLSEVLPVMTIRNHVALGISAATIALSLVFAPAAFAQDKMGKDDAMKKDTMSKDSMSKDGMKKDAMSKDSMSKDHMSKDGMKKDDGMMKKN
jgi:pentapeptide MXKDX repeat protein